MIALQARMQASYQDHVAQTQTLNAKVSPCKQLLFLIFFPSTFGIVCIFPLIQLEFSWSCKVAA